MSDATTTTRLLDAAERRMRRGGYNAVSFRDLASDTDIKSSSVHYHFPRKEDLGIALVERYAARFFDALKERTGDEVTPEARLMAYRAVYRAALTDDDAVCLCGLLGAEMAGLPEAVTEAVRKFFADNIAWLDEALPRSLSAPQRRIRARNLLSAHQGAMMVANCMGSAEIFDNATRTAVETALRAD